MKLRDMLCALGSRVTRMLVAGVLAVGLVPALAFANEIESQAKAPTSIALPSVEEISGDTRYATAARIVEQWAAENGTPGGVIVASAAQYADALGASGLAGVLGYPILLTHPTQLLPETAAALGKLGANLDIVVVGGEAAVGASVERALSPYGSVTRLAGSTRYETNDEILAYGASHGGWRGTPIVATGRNYADALAISPYAYWGKAPIVLADDALSTEAKQILSKSSNAVVLGGTTAVSASVFDEVKRETGAVTRLAGETRYETALKILKWELGRGMAIDEMGFATGANFPDALASGALLGAQRGSVIALMNPKGNNDALIDELGKHGGEASSLTFFGGEKALPQSQRDLVVLALFSTVRLGAYEQDNNAGNGKEPIEWRVLEIKDGRALLLSKHVLDAHAFNALSGGNKWDGSTLRTWLNGDFATQAGLSSYAGSLTLLTVQEVEAYLGDEADLAGSPTKYALAQGVEVPSDGDTCRWWLRTPGDRENRCSYVNYDGFIDTSGRRVDLSTMGVRPAMWVNL